MFRLIVIGSVGGSTLTVGVQPTAQTSTDPAIAALRIWDKGIGQLLEGWDWYSLHHCGDHVIRNHGGVPRRMRASAAL